MYLNWRCVQSAPALPPPTLCRYKSTLNIKSTTFQLLLSGYLHTLALFDLGCLGNFLSEVLKMPIEMKQRMSVWKVRTGLKLVNKYSRKI